MTPEKRAIIFAHIYNSVQEKGVPVKFPPSLYTFIGADDVRQEFFVGVAKRLRKVKEFKPGNGCSPEIGFVVDGGVKAVQDYVRSVCNHNLMPQCGCPVTTNKTNTTCKRCNQPIRFVSKIMDLEVVYDNSISSYQPEKVIDARLQIEGFMEFLKARGSKRLINLMEIFTAKDCGPCNMCSNECKGAISHFEIRNKEWRSGCPNPYLAISKYWGTSSTRVSFLYQKLKELGKIFVGSP